MLQNGLAAAEIMLDEITRTLTATNIGTGWISGQALSKIKFVGSDCSFNFSVNAKGSQVSVNDLSINGYTNTSVYIVKEKSVAPVKTFEGTFGSGTGDKDKGVLNFMLYPNDSLFGIYKYSGGSSHIMHGTLP